MTQFYLSPNINTMKRINHNQGMVCDGKLMKAVSFIFLFLTHYPELLSQKS